VAAEEQQRIFDAEQADGSVTRRFGGTGSASRSAARSSGSCTEAWRW
jgi:hypothetical protein